MSMANLSRMAQQMQQEIVRVQSELESATVEGTAGGGAVKATVTGRQELVSLAIDPGAVNDGLRASRELAESKMAAVTGGLRLPGM